MKRVFSASQKRHLYRSSGGKCEICGMALGDDWEAHHEIRYADGGITEIQNGMALCKACHLSIHKRKDVMTIQPRGWQEDAISKFRSLQKKSFLLQATPGSGKTIFSAFCAGTLIQDKYVDFVIVVVPTTALKGDRDAGFLGDWNKVGIDLTTVLKSGKSAPKDFHGAVITYQQLPNIVSDFEIWKQNGKRLFFVFDEIHHASECNVWGSAAERCGIVAEYILCMTGTPFRGDGRKISFVNYDEDNQVVADFKYSYREAVADRVCRPVLFIHDDGIAEYLFNDDYRLDKISEAKEANISKVSATIFRQDSKWLESVVVKAEAKLDEYRATDGNAGGIVICRPGNDERDDRHLMRVAQLVEKQTGEKPIVITHEDPDANAKIESFRKSNHRWICSVRKISEGVDIKRLKVMVMAARPGTELLFRQLVGRVVRVANKANLEDASVFMARFPQLVEWASKISDEAEAGIKERKERKAKEEVDRTPLWIGDFQAIRSTHENGGATASYGDRYTPEEITRAEEYKRGRPSLSFIPIAAIAEILRDMAGPAKNDYTPIPKHQQKLELRKEIVKLAQRLAIRINPDSPRYSDVWLSIHRKAGVKSIDDLMDNFDIAKMAQVKDLLIAMLQESSHAA